MTSMTALAVARIDREQVRIMPTAEFPERWKP
jgi:hypothetical protein